MGGAPRPWPWEEAQVRTPRGGRRRRPPSAHPLIREDGARLPAPLTNREREGVSKPEGVLVFVAVLGDASSGRFDNAGQAELCRTRP